MYEIPEKTKLKHINGYPSLQQLLILKDICNKIYIARNISMSEEQIIENLEKIDILFRDKSNFN
jgi:hypothetical protein